MHPSHSWRCLCALLAGALLAGPGCTRRYIVPVDELQKLDGFGGPPGSRERALQTADGSTITFTSSSSLRLVGPEVQGRFSHIQLTPTQLEGVLIGSDEPLKVDLATIQFAQVEGVDTVSTLVTVLTVVVAVPALYFGFSAVALANTPPPER